MQTPTDTLLQPAGAASETERWSEPERLVVLASYEWDQLRGDEELAELAQFAARLCETPTGAVSLVEAERQVFIAHEGLKVNETPRSVSICAHTMRQTEVFEVRDCTKDPRFADFASVLGERHLRFYAGAPLISSEGAPLGAVCVTDTVPRPEGLSDLQRQGLEVLARSVKRRIEAHREAARAVQEIKSSADRLQFMLDSVPDIAWSAAPGMEFDYFNARFSEVTGLPPCRTIDDWRAVIHPDDFEPSLAKFEEAALTSTMFEDEWRLRLADGSYRWILGRAVPSTDDPATARWFGTLTDIHDRYRISQERELLAGELAHRIKNIFSVITGLISLRTRGDKQIKTFAEGLSENILALSRAQDFALRAGQTGDEDLISMLEVLMAPYGIPGSEAVTITGDNTKAGHAAATPLALVFHELATNSAKYGALSAAEGRVSITIDSAGDTVSIKWEESGGPALSQPLSEGFGSRLIAMTITHQLNGTIEREWRGEGLQVNLAIPRDQLEK